VAINQSQRYQTTPRRGGDVAHDLRVERADQSMELGWAVENAPNLGKQRHNVASDGFRFHELINGKDNCVLAVIADVPHNEAERGKETLNSALTLRKHSKKSSKDTLGKQK